MALFNKGWSVPKGVEPLMGNWLEFLDLHFPLSHAREITIRHLKGALEVEKKSEMPVSTKV